MSKKIKCLLVDDEPLAITVLEKHIQQFSRLEIVGSCWNAVQAFELLKEQRVDLIFLDIQMPGLTGIEFVKSLQQPPAIIFTTAYRDYAVESYELDVIDYLVKPITLDRFFKSINKFFDRLDSKTPTTAVTADTDEELFIYVNTNRRFVKVIFKEVLFIESLKDYIRIHTLEQKIMTKDKISEFEKKLSATFIRVHRSYIVNTKKIAAFTQHDIEINGTEIPIGISYKKEVLAFLKKD